MKHAAEMLRCLDIHTKFHKIRSGIQKLMGWGIHTDRKDGDRISLLYESKLKCMHLQIRKDHRSQKLTNFFMIVHSLCDDRLLC
jgi:hypothetical protein